MSQARATSALRGLLTAGRCPIALVLAMATTSSGCMALAPQLPPTDFEKIERTGSRDARDQLYAEQQIYKHDRPQGMRYSKGTSNSEQPRSWQSLDVVLRSNADSAAALPIRQVRRSRLFAALTVAAGILTIAGAAASAREGLNLGDLNPTGGVLIGGGLASVGFAITSGVFYGKSRAGYERAVDVYNDSLGMRLGVLDGAGEYIPPRGSITDEDGNLVLTPTVDTASDAPPQPAPVAPSSELPVSPQTPAPASEPKEPIDADEADDDAAEPEEQAPSAADTVEEPPTPSPSKPQPGADPSVSVPPPGAATARLRLHPRI